MSLERRISVFNPCVLPKVEEEAYHWFSIVSEGFIVEFNGYLKKEITIQQLRDNLDVKGNKSIVDETIKVLAKEYSLKPTTIYKLD